MKKSEITAIAIAGFLLFALSGCSASSDSFAGTSTSSNQGGSNQSILNQSILNQSISSDLNLEEQICTDEVLTYELDDGTTIRSSVQDFEILSSRTTDEHDSSEVKVVLSDDLLERTLYISTESTKYNQGWLIDYMTVTEISFNLIGEIDQNSILSYLSEDRIANYGQGNISNYRTLGGIEAGLYNLTATSTSIQDNAFVVVYEVNDSHQYADISGTIYVRVDLTMSADASSGACYVTRSFEVDTEGVTTNWHDIYGTYLLSIPGKQNWQQYITVDKNQDVYGYREFEGAWDSGIQHADLNGTFDEVNYSTAIVFVSDSENYFEYIIFTPDAINYRYLWPNGTDYDDGADYNKVYFEKIN